MPLYLWLILPYAGVGFRRISPWLIEFLPYVLLIHLFIFGFWRRYLRYRISWDFYLHLHICVYWLHNQRYLYRNYSQRILEAMNLLLLMKSNSWVGIYLCCQFCCCWDSKKSIVCTYSSLFGFGLKNWFHEIDYLLCLSSLKIYCSE